MRMKPKKLSDAFKVFKSSIGKLSEGQSRVYTDGLVLWLGVYQALESVSCRGSLIELYSERSYELIGECKRKALGEISDNSGGLIQARQKIGFKTLQEVLFNSYKYIRKNHLWNGYRVVGVDGSTVALNASTAALLKSYPGGMDHKGKSRWPIVHMVLLVDLLEGTTMTINLGAKYGKNAKSEQSLVLDVINLIKEKALVVGDRNYGTLKMAKELNDNGTDVLIRLSKPVAASLAKGCELADGLDKKVSWEPSKAVKSKHGYSLNDKVEGRLIVKKFNYKGETVQVNLFTTLDIADPTELVDLYKKRWSIEEDLKTMKQQLKLKQVQAVTKAAVEVEIFCKFLAFNITRGVILLAVENTDIDPRRISFALAFIIVRRGLSEYSNAKTAADKQEIIEFMYDRIRAARIPYRPGRSSPRQTYCRRPGRYPEASSRL